MNSQPNTAFFHPTKTVRPGFFVDELYDARDKEIRQGLLLGSSELVRAREGDLEYKARRARRGSQVVWTLDGAPLQTERNLLANASIVDTPTEKGGVRHLLAAPVGNGKHLVLIQTGLVGSKDDHIRQILENANKGLLPGAHGSIAIDDGSRALTSAEDDGLLDGLTEEPGVARHLRWWRPRTMLPGTDRIRARVMDLWELSPGAEILVGDIVAGREHRIVIRDGRIQAVEAPSNARDMLQEALARRTKPSIEPEVLTAHEEPVA